MRKGLTISAIAHAMVLLWSLITFAPRPLSAPTDSVPVDVISANEFSRMTAGSRTAPKAPTPKPVVDKVGETKLADNPAAKVTEKPEIVQTADKQTPQPEAKPEPKRETERKQPPPKPDPIAEALKKEQTKPEPKKEEAKVPTPPHRPDPPRPQPKFDAVRIAALLDKRDSQRQVSLGDIINQTPRLGTPKGNAPVLSQSEIEAFKRKVQLCWTLPAGAPNADKLRVDITIRLRRDGTLDGMPQLDRGGSDAFGRTMNESAVRALIQCQPYTMFAPEKYDDWKEIPMSFDPIEMFGG